MNDSPMGSDNLLSMHRLFNDVLRLPIERKVSEYLGRPWRVEMIHDRNDRASHPATILSDGVLPVFAKFGDNLAEDHFRQEVVGLELIAGRSRVLTPAVIANIKVENGTIMILEAVQEVERKSREWRQIGHALALLHQANPIFMASKLTPIGVTSTRTTT